MSFIQMVFETIFQWLDLFWIPLALVFVDPRQWWKAVGFVLSCVLTLRLQVEILDTLGIPHGLLPFIDSSPYVRGLMIYGLFIILFFWLSKYYKRLDPFIFLAASFSLFGGAFCVSSVIMLL